MCDFGDQIGFGNDIVLAEKNFLSVRRPHFFLAKEWIAIKRSESKIYIPCEIHDVSGVAQVGHAKEDDE